MTRYFALLAFSALLLASCSGNNKKSLADTKPDEEISVAKLSEYLATPDAGKKMLGKVILTSGMVMGHTSKTMNGEYEGYLQLEAPGTLERIWCSVNEDPGDLMKTKVKIKGEFYYDDEDHKGLRNCVIVK